MLPKQLRIKNYLTFEEAVIDFSKIRKALILGIRNNDISSSNGAGKSNLLRSIPWCLWGINPEAENIDQNVRWGTDACLVEFEFEHHNKNYIVSRGRNAKTGLSTLDLTIDGVPSNGHSIAETTKHITKILNLDYDSYINSCYIKQNDIYSLANSKDKNESRELLERVMGLQIYEDYYEATEKIISSLTKRRDEIFEIIQKSKQSLSLRDSVIASLEANIEKFGQKNKEVKELTASLAKLSEEYESARQIISSKDSVAKEHRDAVDALEIMNRELTDLTNKANRFRDEWNSRKDDHTKTLEDGEQLIADTKDLEDRAKQSAEADIRINAISSEMRDKSSEISAAQKLISDIDTQINIQQHDIRKHIGEINVMNTKINTPNVAIGSRCDFCLTDINEQTLEHYVGHLTTSITEKQKSIDDANTKIDELKSQKPQHTKIINEIEVVKNNLSLEKDSLLGKKIDERMMESQKRALSKRSDAIKNANIELEKMSKSTDLVRWRDTVIAKRNDISEKTSVVQELSTKIDANYEQDDIRIGQMKSKIDDDGKYISKMASEIYILDSLIESKQSEINEFDIINQEMETKQSELAQVEHDLKIYAELLNAFSPKGIRYHILGTAIDELEKEANELMPKLSLGNLTIKFKTKKEIQKSKKGNQEKLVFDAFINDGEKEFPFSTYSGGEQFRISFVIRIALSNLLLKRVNSDMQFLIIDEAISPLDQAGIEMIIPTINELQELFKVILVITHRSDVKQYFDEVITIRRNKYVSSIEEQ